MPDSSRRRNTPRPQSKKKGSERRTTPVPGKRASSRSSPVPRRSPLPGSSRLTPRPTSRRMTARSRHGTTKDRIITAAMWLGLIGVLATIATVVIGRSTAPKKPAKAEAAGADGATDASGEAVAEKPADGEAPADAPVADDGVAGAEAPEAPAADEAAEAAAAPPPEEQEAEDAEAARAPIDIADAGDNDGARDGAGGEKDADEDAADPVAAQITPPAAPVKPVESPQVRIRRTRARSAAALLANLPPVAGPVVGGSGEPGEWAPGVLCELFADARLTQRVLTRVEHGVRFDPQAPLPLLESAERASTFRCTGFLLAPVAGAYVFSVSSHEIVGFTIDGQPVENASVRRWGQGEQFAREYKSDDVQLSAGLHPIVVVMADVSGGRGWRGSRGVEMRWRPPGAKNASGIAGAYLYHTVPEAAGDPPEGALAPGLRAEVFADKIFRRTLASFTFEGARFDFGQASPCTICPGYNYSLRLAGHLLVPSAGTYAFDIDSPHVCRLLIDGETVAERGVKGATNPGEGEVDLGGGYHEFAIEYVPRSRPAKAHIRWKHDDTRDQFRDIPATSLFHGLSGDEQAPKRGGTTPGLECSYYRGETFRGEASSRGFDTGVGVNFDELRPAGTDRDGFSVLWKGHLLVPQRGLYSFRLRRRGGAVLMIGGAAIINDWRPNAETEKGQAPLRAGVVPIQIRYFNRDGSPLLEIDWSGPGFPFRRLRGPMLVRKTTQLALAPPWGGHVRDDEKRADAAKAATVAAVQRVAVSREPLPEGNLVENAGFEKADDKRFAAGWRKFGAGPAGSRSSVRIDAGNAHGGDVAMAVRAGPGSTAGTYTTLKLVAAKYEITLWASADIDKTAEVFAHLAGVDLEPRRVTEEWTELTFTTTVPKAKLNASFRVCTATAGVRVWFDDVSLVATGHLPVVEER